jgi:hypothetical protein
MARDATFTGNELLTLIDNHMDTFDNNDAQGFIEWFRFRGFIESQIERKKSLPIKTNINEKHSNKE